MGEMSCIPASSCPRHKSCVPPAHSHCMLVASSLLEKSVSCNVYGQGTLILILKGVMKASHGEKQTIVLPNCEPMNHSD